MRYNIKVSLMWTTCSCAAARLYEYKRYNFVLSTTSTFPRVAMIFSKDEDLIALYLIEPWSSVKKSAWIIISMNSGFTLISYRLVMVRAIFFIRQLAHPPCIITHDYD
jgi:hypothetical protein